MTEPQQCASQAYCDSDTAGPPLPVGVNDAPAWPFPPMDMKNVAPYCEPVGDSATLNFGTCGGGTYGTCSRKEKTGGTCKGPATGVVGDPDLCLAISANGLVDESECTSKTSDGLTRPTGGLRE